LCGRIRNGVEDGGYGFRGSLRYFSEDLGGSEVTGEDEVCAEGFDRFCILEGCSGDDRGESGEFGQLDGC